MFLLCSIMFLLCFAYVILLMFLSRSCVVLVIYIYHVLFLFLSCTYHVLFMFLSCTYHVLFMFLSCFCHVVVTLFSRCCHIKLLSRCFHVFGMFSSRSSYGKSMARLCRIFERYCTNLHDLDRNMAKSWEPLNRIGLTRSRIDAQSG